MPILRCPYLMSIPVVYSLLSYLLSKPRCRIPAVNAMMSKPRCQFHDVNSMMSVPVVLLVANTKMSFTMMTEPRCHGSISFWCKTWCENRRKKALCPRTKRLRFRYYSLFMLSIRDIFLFVNKKIYFQYFSTKMHLRSLMLKLKHLLYYYIHESVYS